MSIAENIKHLRKQKKMTQKQLAEKSGLAVITIQQYEAGKYNPKPDAVMKLCVGLNCKITDIIDDETQKYYRMFDNLKETENIPQYTDSDSDNNIHKYDGSIRVDMSSPLKAKEIKQKIENGEDISEEERQWYEDYNSPERFKEGFQRLGNSLREIAHILKPLYEQLNEKGTEKAIEYTKDLTKIPEYQRKPPESPEE